MTPARTERVPKEQARAYLTKAEEFRWAMENALVAGKLNPAVSGAVHCVTSACDALLAHHLGVRCKGQDHREILSLLPGLPFRVGPERPRQILAVLDLKAVAEYEGRSATSQEARNSVRQALRILEWVRQNLPPSTPGDHGG